MLENLQMSDTRSIDESVGFLRRLWREQKFSIMTVVILILVGIVVIEIGILVWKKVQSSNDPRYSNVTLTNFMTLYAENIRHEVHPCDDFYDFACSRLINKYEQEKDSDFATVTSLRKAVMQSFQTLFSPTIVESDSATMKKLKGFYQMCINQSKVEIEGKEPILKLLRKVGGWPLLDGAGRFNKTKNWQEAVGQVNRAGFGSMFPFRVDYETDPKDPTKLAVVLETFIDARYYTQTESKSTSDYVELLAKSLRSENPRLMNDVTKCVLFEEELVQITMSSQTKEPEIYSVADLSMRYPGIRTLCDYVFASMSIKLCSNDTVILKNPDYSTRIEALLDSEDVSTIRNYLVWKILEEVINFANLEPRGASFNLRSQNVLSSRSQICIEVLLEKAPFTMGLVYGEYHFKPLVKSEVETIFKNIKNQAFAYLNESTWIDEKSKMNIFARLRSVKMIVGYPDGNLNTEYVQNLVKDWHFHSNDSTVENYRSLLTLHQRTHLNKFRISQDERELISSLEYSIKTEALYLRSIHTIQISAGLMQEPLFSLQQPKYLSYGGIGVVAAHELSHSLNIFWECDTRICPSYYEFRKRRRCAQKLYDNYTIKRINQKVNGTRTLDENICDLMGLQIAYRAYNDWIKEHGGSESALPDLICTAQQLFWINAAVTHCSYLNDAALIFTMENDEHSPPEARVNVAFSNSDDFAHDFTCPVDSKINPRKKCRL